MQVKTHLTIILIVSSYESERSRRALRYRVVVTKY